MLRTTATRSLLKSFTKLPTSRATYSKTTSALNTASTFRTSIPKRPSSALPSRLFYATKSEPPYIPDQINTEEEAALKKQTIEPHPEAVSLKSSVRPVFEEKPHHESHGSVRDDLETIKETFALREVPRESLIIGAAGVLPYAATSASTIYLAYDINHAHATGQGILFSPETAHQLLDYITPIQVGYGAVIISFLGAIHWGLEYAGYGGNHSYRRYMIGVVAPAVAWPTILMPVEYALITQFTAFTFLYFTDARATVRGWCPPWYSTYRFVLTFIVGAAIVASLVGRGRIVTHDRQLKSSVDYIKEDRDNQWLALEQEEKMRRAKLAEEEKTAEEEEAEDESEDEEKSDEKKEDKKESKDEK
ncbi:ac31da42-3a9b-4f6b-8d23-3636d2f1ccdf [Sclerotinia trifoliorum]|uniref:Ac31da42-3a9b-4f6b-8d23-3636d2f1ccdf n=1 Tax=Sclerotinia trifoliorum TaxID=28548 RepID=A0A8H2VW34_9HELO|nr:ac31da42-3a9b-4f6b-8d23-3636d2f1ccdf [Sclerotinia trifoliorum]